MSSHTHRQLEAIVVGLGAVGSAAIYHLARRGQRVLGLDRFAPPHTQGSSHGGSRIIRKAYFEGEMYLPLLDRGYDLWRALEAETGQSLMQITGGLNIGLPEQMVVAGARHAAETYGLTHEVLTPEEVRTRFPAFHVPEGHRAVWEAEAGLLYPETCIIAHLDAARHHGADVHLGEPVLKWKPDGEGVAVTTVSATYHAARLLLCAGGWIRDLLPDLDLPLRIERQVNGWFRPKANADYFTPARCPIYLWEFEPDALIYGFPDLGHGVKAGLHHQSEKVDHPDALDRVVHPADEAALRRRVRDLLPDADGKLVRAATCFYTNTPDEDYLIDTHPAHPQVLFASACSGHGFKASNAIGEALAERASGTSPTLDLARFGLTRWA